MPNFEEITKCSAATSFKVTGKLIKSPAEGQPIEMQVNDPETHSVEIVGKNMDPRKYPMAKKGHSNEHLRTVLHLRPRSRMIQAMMRVRNAAAMATHLFYQSNNFIYVHTPILTGSDCEGAGEMFQVSTLLTGDKPADIPIKKKNKKIDYKKDFFARKAFLTVSGQLNVEPFACSMSNVYTFGPTFRSEESHTTRHLAEFWMIEPEIAFAGLEEDMAVAEASVKFAIEYVVANCKDDLEFFNEHVFSVRFPDQNLLEYLNKTLTTPFRRMTYTEAIEILEKAVAAEEIKFENEVSWGVDLASEHERYICEKIVNGPVFLYNYPKDIKAFYMKDNEDGKTVQAMDLLVPLVGELIGGSVREDRFDVLQQKIKAHKLDMEDYKFYLDLRKYGSVPHAGYGLGFERLVIFLTGIENIRDAIPYPRAHGQMSN